MSAEAELRAGRRLWAAIVLARSLAVAESIVLGRRVRAGELDGEALRRALRGAPLPDPAAFLAITGEMLDALSEAGPIPLPRRTPR